MTADDDVSSLMTGWLWDNNIVIRRYFSKLISSGRSAIWPAIEPVAT